MKKLILLGFIVILTIPGAFAQVRLDLAIEVPVILGITAKSNDSNLNDSINLLKDIGTFTFPSAMVAYQFPIGPVKTGIGLKAYSIIFETIAWPYAYVELDLSPIVINAGVGGLGFLWFGLWNNAAGSNILIPDIHIAYKIGKTFRLGLGAIAFTGIEGLESVVPYTIFLTGRFSILFDE